MEERKLRWAVLGTGTVAKEMAIRLGEKGIHLYAVASRTYENALRYAQKYCVEKVYENMDQIFTDPLVDIVYIATPHNTHYPLIKKALENGKHVLAEKSITLNSRELDEVVQLSKDKGLVLAEAMTIWHMPLYKKLWKMIADGEMGKVRMITVNFGSFKDWDMTNRYFSKELAGGALLDIGVYALSVVRGFMEQSPDWINSQMRPAPTGVDEQATILLMNEAGQMATVALTMRAKQPKRAMISCEKGYIEIMEFNRGDSAVYVDTATRTVHHMQEGNTNDALYYEMLDMEQAVLTGNQDIIKLQYSADVMRIMTELRNDWALEYPEEE